MRRLRWSGRRLGWSAIVITTLLTPCPGCVIDPLQGFGLSLETANPLHFPAWIMGHNLPFGPDLVRFRTQPGCTA